jgi:hypothetical protein
MSGSPPPPRVRLRVLPRDGFDDALLAPLHAMANRLMAETYDRFLAHAVTNDVVHVFERDDTGEVVGFQFWKTAPVDLPGARAIVGGKLRVVPAFRGRALHLSSGLRFLAEAQLRHPGTRFYRLSLASIFGFTSIASALARYHFYDPAPGDDETRAVSAAFERIAQDSGYTVDRATGLFDVRIHMTAETLARYPAAFFAKPAARAYARVNPGYRDNGCYVGFWFRFGPKNLAAITKAIARARLRAAEGGAEG